MASPPDAESEQPPPKRLRPGTPADDSDAPAEAVAEAEPRPDDSDAPVEAEAEAEPRLLVARSRVELNPADCNLDFDVSGGGLQGQALHEGGFAYCWSGARAAVGVRGGGRYCFGCKVIAEQAVEMDDTEAGQRHLCRVGVSRGDDPVGALGESGHSFGYGGTGKFSHEGKFLDYGGVRFGVGDTVVCAVDLDSKPMASIGFSKNGEWLGIAKYFDATEKGLGLVDSPVRQLQWESAIFPHVLLKNVVVKMQFSRQDGLEPVVGYEPWASAFADGNAVLGPVFAEQKDCEILMMVGLPASGKSTWADKWVKEHPEKRYVLLGTNLALDQMKVPGLLRKHNYGERFERLMDRATVIFNTLLERAAKIPHNYIIDQTNVYQSARIRKLRPFAKYSKTAVVVFPLPSELKSRAAKRFKEMGKEVPTEAIDQMTANFVLPLSKDMPGSKEPFEEVIFIELSRDDAQKNLDEMRRLLPRVPTPSFGNLNNQNVSLTHAGTVSPAIPGARPSPSGLHAQVDLYGRGVPTLRAMAHQQAPPRGVGFQSTPGNQNQIQSSYPTPYQHQMQSSYPTPYQHQIHPSYPSTPNQEQNYPSYPNTTNQQQIHPSYTSTTNQHQIHPSYPSTTNQQQIHQSYSSNANQHQTYGSYPSTLLPAYGHSTYAYHGTTNPYNPSPDSTNIQQRVQGPMGDASLYQTLGSAEAYAVPGYEATNSTGRPVHAHPSTVATYGLMPYPGVHNTGSLYATPLLSPAALPPNYVNPPPNHWNNQQ